MRVCIVLCVCSYALRRDTGLAGRNCLTLEIYLVVHLTLCMTSAFQKSSLDTENTINLVRQNLEYIYNSLKQTQGFV